MNSEMCFPLKTTVMHKTSACLISEFEWDRIGPSHYGRSSIKDVLFVFINVTDMLEHRKD